MINLKDILVTTTSSIDGLEVKQYLKPISAHIVAGTNFFSDFFASFSDVFGGRSQTYQKQLTSLYNEAIERLRISAYEIGANCILGLYIDMDEISGKGKSMFMLTAIGTAVIVDDTNKKKPAINTGEKFENVGVDRMKTLLRRRQIIENANVGNLQLTDEIWDFIISNQVYEVFGFILLQLRNTVHYYENEEKLRGYFKRTISFLDALPEEKRLELLYTSILTEDNEQLALKLCSMVEDLQLLDFNYIVQIFQLEEFQKQKRGLRIVTYDKPFYDKHDIEQLHVLIILIKEKFKERCVRAMKKQFLSSKEKEVWNCECGKINDIETYHCINCNKDIYGFLSDEVSPPKAISQIEEKISLISEYLLVEDTTKEKGKILN